MGESRLAHRRALALTCFLVKQMPCSRFGVETQCLVSFAEPQVVFRRLVVHHRQNKVFFVVYIVNEPFPAALVEAACCPIIVARTIDARRADGHQRFRAVVTEPACVEVRIDMYIGRM